MLWKQIPDLSFVFYFQSANLNKDHTWLLPSQESILFPKLSSVTEPQERIPSPLLERMKTQVP
jgi:hypothetical protein